MSQTSGPAGQFGARLHQIADALGITVSQLHGDEPPPLLSDALVLLSVYAAIPDAQGRQRVLSVAQREAERCRAHVAGGRPDSIGAP